MFEVKNDVYFFGLGIGGGGLLFICFGGGGSNGKEKGGGGMPPKLITQFCVCIVTDYHF